MIHIDNLSLQRGDKQLIASLSLHAKLGGVIVVLGPNGAGKSTLLLTLAGLHHDYTGKVLVQGKALADFSQQSLVEHIAWQGELPPTEFGLTVEQRLNLAAHGVTARLEHALTYLELELLKHRALGELSSGEQQRVEIAAVMVRDCPVWLMDEPAAHLDMRHQVDCLKLIKQQAHNGRLIITVLHDLQHAAAVADMVILLDGNGGAEVGLAEEMLVAEKLEPVFKIKLKCKGRNLMPQYAVELSE